jgi:hypothetical protein
VEWNLRWRANRLLAGLVPIPGIEAFVLGERFEQTAPMLT